MGNLIRFGTDGWRARADGDFNETNVARVAEALGRIWEQRYPAATVYVGFDTYGSAQNFARFAGESLAVYNLKIKIFKMPAPISALGWTIAQDSDCCGGIMITASTKRRETMCFKIRLANGVISNEDFTNELENEIAPVPNGLQDTIESVSCMPATFCRRMNMQSFWNL